LDKGQEALDKILAHNASFKDTTIEPHAANQQLTETGKMHSTFFHALQLLRLQRLQRELPPEVAQRMPFGVSAERARTLVARVAESGDADLARIALSDAAEFTSPEMRETLIRNILANNNPGWAALAYLNGVGLDESQKTRLKSYAMQDREFQSYLQRRN